MSDATVLSEHVSGSWAEGNVTERVVSLQCSRAHKYTPALWGKVAPSIFYFINNLAFSYFCYPIIWIWRFETQVNWTEIKRSWRDLLPFTGRTGSALTFSTSAVTQMSLVIQLHVYEVTGGTKISDTGKQSYRGTVWLWNTYLCTGIDVNVKNIAAIRAALTSLMEH